MPTLGIVPALDEVKDRHPRFGMTAETVPVEKLAFQGGEETLAQDVVIAVADRSHRRSHAEFLTAISECDRRVLRARVEMMNDFLGAALPDRHVHRLHDECGAQMVRHRPANHTATENVDNDSKIHETRPCGHVGDVGHSEFVRMLRLAILIDQIRSRTGIAIPNRRQSPFAAAGTLGTGRFHQACHTLPSHMVSCIDQFGMNSRDPVGRSGMPMNVLDLGLKFPIGPPTGQWLPIPPCIVAAGGDAQNSAHRSYWIIGLIGSHEFVDPSGIVPVSGANQAAAFDRILRSCFSRRFSRRKRRSSSCSAVVRPSLRRPESSSACWTQFRIVCEEGSNSRPSSSGVRPDGIKVRSSAVETPADTRGVSSPLRTPFSQRIICPPKRVDSSTQIGLL